MNLRSEIPNLKLRRRRPRRAFSFTEVLFAVMVLGIGFIMIAAMFPVTIRQQQTTFEETVGASTANMALAYLQNNDILKNLQRTGNSEWERCQVFSAGENRNNNKDIWETIAGNFVLPENPRVAWVPLFRRPNNELGVAQVYMFVVFNRNRPAFETMNVDPTQPPVRPDPILQGKDIFRIAGNAKTLKDKNPDYATLEPKPVLVTTLAADKNPKSNGLDWIEFVREKSGSSSKDVDYREAAAEGGYVVIADVEGADAFMNGRVYQMGARVDVGTPDRYVFELIPGNDLAPGDVELTKSKGSAAYIIGRALRDPTIPWDPDSTRPSYNPFEGPTQDVAIYTGFVRLPQLNPVILP